MKKLLTMVACLAVCFCLAACGEEPSDSSSAKNTTAAGENTTVATTEATTAATTEATTEATTTETQGKENAGSMQAFIDSIQDQIDDMSAAMSASGLDMKVTARGNSLVYTYQYTIDVGETSVLKPALEQATEGLSDTFENILKALKISVPDAESIIVEYLDKDGKLILSKEYK